MITRNAQHVITAIAVLLAMSGAQAADLTDQQIMKRHMDGRFCKFDNVPEMQLDESMGGGAITFTTPAPRTPTEKWLMLTSYSYDWKPSLSIMIFDPKYKTTRIQSATIYMDKRKIGDYPTSQIVHGPNDYVVPVSLKSTEGLLEQFEAGQSAVVEIHAPSGAVLGSYDFDIRNVRYVRKAITLTNRKCR